MKKTFYTIAAVFAVQSIALLICYVGVHDISVFYISAISLMLALIALLIGVIISLSSEHKQTSMPVSDNGLYESDRHRIDADFKRMQGIVHRYYKLRSEDGE